MKIAKSLILIGLTFTLTSQLTYGQNKQAHKTGEAISEREQDGFEAVRSGASGWRLRKSRSKDGS
jgi:hypothetical protein